MLKVYAASWCPHCQRTVAFLKDKSIAFAYLEIEEQPEDIINKIIEVNGGEDWVVPTLEYNGHWRPGQVFNAAELEKDLRAMGAWRE